MADSTTTSFDCERSHNGFGIVGRECDCAPETPPFETCERCCGNGEIVTDWDRYLKPRTGDVGDESVAECPDCNGEGTKQK